MRREYILTAHLLDVDLERNPEELRDVAESIDTPRGMELRNFTVVDADSKEVIVGRR